MRAVTRRSVLGAAFAATVAGCGPVEDPATAGDPSAALHVGVIRSRTGVFAAEGGRVEQGLRAGFRFATNNTGRIGSRTIRLTWLDDESDPDNAAAAAEELNRRGVRLIAGGVTGASALRIAAVAERHQAVFLANAPDDRLTGLNRYTFRTGRQTYQDLAAARGFRPAGGRMVVYGPDSSAASVLGAAGTVRSGSSIARTRPDVLFVSWPTATRKLWQDVPDGLPVVTVLGARSTWPAYPPSLAAQLRLVTSYVDGAAENSAYIALRGRVPALRTDTGHPEGFTAAQMIVEALQAAPDDPDGMIRTLEGAHLSTVKGDVEIRAADHALLQQMYQVSLTWVGASGALTAVTTTTLEPEQTAPPL